MKTYNKKAKNCIYMLTSNINGAILITSKRYRTVKESKDEDTK